MIEIIKEDIKSIINENLEDSVDVLKIKINDYIATKKARREIYDGVLQRITSTVCEFEIKLSPNLGDEFKIGFYNG